MNINDLKNRLAQLNKRTQKSNDLWKAKDEHDIRLLRSPHNDDPFPSLHFHYEIGDSTSVLCPKENFGDDCAICEFCNQLKAWKDADGNDKRDADKKADWEIFKKIQPKARVFVAMVERTKESEGAKWWGISSNQAGELLNECTDGEMLADLGIEPDDAVGALNVLFGKRAYDVHVSYAKVGEKGNTKTFPQTSFKTKKKATPITKSDEDTKKLLESIKPLSEIYPRVSSNEVEKIFQKFVGNSAKETDDTEAGVEKYSKPSAPANTKENAKMAGTRSIDEAFGDMLADEG